MTQTKTMDTDYLRSILSYDPISGDLTWKIRPDTNHRDRWFNGRFGGKVAGKIHLKSGYRVVKIEGKYWLAHRLAWMIMYGECPPELDHRDHVKSNNVLTNLRPATRLQNARNVPKPITELPRGVFKTVSGRFKAQIGVDRRQVYLMTWDTAEQAARAYRGAAILFHGEFAYKESRDAA